MYPTMVFGFVLLAAIVLHALRPEPRYERVIAALGVATLTSGVLGTVVGVCNTVHFLKQVPREDKLEVFLMGMEESLHVVVLALIMVTLAALASGAIALRNRAAR